MFNITSLPVPRADHGRSGEGMESIIPHLQRQHSWSPELGFELWADTCPGSYDRLWNKELQRQHSHADDAFPATLAMGLSDI